MCCDQFSFIAKAGISPERFAKFDWREHSGNAHQHLWKKDSELSPQREAATHVDMYIVEEELLVQILLLVLLH